MRKGVTTQLSVSIYYDDEQMTQEQAIAEMHERLGRIEVAGLVQGDKFSIEFGSDWDPQEFDPVNEWDDAYVAVHEDDTENYAF